MEVSFPKIDLPFAKFSNDPGPATPSLIPALKDCTATLSQEAQDLALTHNFGMFSHPMNHDEFLKLLA
jgi:hypothetical protein